MSESDRQGPENDRGGAGGLPSLSSEDDGVDVSLIRWMLSLNHRERLQVLEQNAKGLMRLVHARRGN